MKFITSTPFSQLQNGHARQTFYTLPDTALRQGGQPFFIPDLQEPCTGTLSLALRVSRQGRSIARQFTNRYYDAATCALHFTRQDTLRTLAEAGMPWDEAVGFDGAVCIGKWQEILSEKGSPKFEISLSNVDNAQQTIALSDIEELISESSLHFTLHQGDIILCHTPRTFIGVPDMRVQGSLNGQELLSFNIK